MVSSLLLLNISCCSISLVDLTSDLFGRCHKHQDDGKDQKRDHSHVRSGERTCCRYHGDQENAEALDDLEGNGYDRPCILEAYKDGGSSTCAEGVVCDVPSQFPKIPAGHRDVNGVIMTSE